MTSILSCLPCYRRPPSTASGDAPSVQSAGGSASRLRARLSGLATATYASVRLGVAIGTAVTAGLAAKAGYIAAMMAAGATANKVLSTGIVLGSTLVVQSGVGALAEGVRCRRQARQVPAPAYVAFMKVLGVAAYLAAMLPGAYRAMQEEDTRAEGAYMLAHAAGQVLSCLVAEMVAERLVPRFIVPTELVDSQGRRIEEASDQARALRTGSEAALIVGQVAAHVALMAYLLDKVPAMQPALGAPAGFRPGQDSPEAHVRAGLGVAIMVGSSEIGRVAMGGLAMGLAQTLQGATIRSVRPQLQTVETLDVEVGQVPADVEMQAPGPSGSASPLTHWQQLCQAADQAGHRIGLGVDGRARMATYGPILNLTVDALTTGPGSRFIQTLAHAMKKPVFDVAIGVSNFTLSLLNAADGMIRARQPVSPGADPDGSPIEEGDFLNSPSERA